MNGYREPLVAGLLLLAATSVCAGERELRTVRLAEAVLHARLAEPVREIPAEQVRTAAAVAVFPQLLEAGLLLGGQFGRGVLMARRPDGSWDEPVFLSLSGGSVGAQAGVATAELILVFRTPEALRKVLAGSFRLDGDAAVALGPIAGKVEGEVSSGWGPDVLCFVRGRGGMFAGVSVAGAWLQVDRSSSTAFSHRPGSREEALLQMLRVSLTRLCAHPRRGRSRRSGQ